MLNKFSLSSSDQKSNSQIGFSLGFALILLLFLAGLLFQRNFAYFRDYSITFEGAYRLALGQIPFRDFGSPVGPVSFLIPAIFFKLFGASLQVFQIAQLFTNFIHLVLLVFIFQKLALPLRLQFASMLLFGFAYLIFLTHPWYNSTGFLTLELVILLSLYQKKRWILINGIICAASVLTKQDFGVVSIFNASIIYILVDASGSTLRLRSHFSELFSRAFFHQLLKTFSIFGIGFVISLSLFIVCTSPSDFLYWFNYGQAPHQPRSPSFRSLTQNSYGLINLIALFFCFKFKRVNLLIAALLIFSASLTRQTSGLGFTHYYYVLALPIVLYEIYQCRWKYKFIALLLAIVFSIQLLKKPVRDAYFVMESMVLHQSEHFFFDYRELSQPLIKFPADFVALNQEIVPQETIAGIQAIKAYVAQFNGTPKVLNLSELTPIYAELKVAPPKHLPLWFHTNFSLFPREIDQLNQSFENAEYDLIILQGAHEGLTPTYQKFLELLTNNPKYHLLTNIYNSPGVGTGPCRENCDGNIFVFTLMK
jgi:hypothetical protein